MKIVREIENYKKSSQPLYLALGNFDGVHLGHKQLMKSLIENAHANGGMAGAFIFEPHPVKVLFPHKELKLLVTTDMQASLLQALGLDVLIYNTFSLDISRWSPQEFVEKILVDTLAVKEVYVGFNYSFGHRGVGTPELLKELGMQYGFAVHIIPPVEYHGAVISSTLVRVAIEEGRIDLAQNLLGYYPVVQGRVVEGEHRGATIGFPTANLAVSPELVVPGKGVYAAWAQIQGQFHKAVVNIGSKPTFHPDYPVVIEAHLIDFSGDIYGTEVKLFFIAKIRDEQKFDGVGALVAQIGSDRDRAAATLGDGNQPADTFTF